MFGYAPLWVHKNVQFDNLYEKDFSKYFLNVHCQCYKMKFIYFVSGCGSIMVIIMLFLDYNNNKCIKCDINLLRIEFDHSSNKKQVFVCNST